MDTKLMRNAIGGKCGCEYCRPREAPQPNKKGKK